MPKLCPVAPAGLPPAAATDPGLERLRLYLLRLDPAAAAELPARLAQLAARVEARLGVRRPGQPPLGADERAALLLAEAQALYAAPPAAPALPAEAPAAMPEQRLRYHQPLRALRLRLAVLLAAPASKPARER